MYFIGLLWLFGIQLLQLSAVQCANRIPTTPTPTPNINVQVQNHEYRISENNDTVYVRQIMRLAKAAEMRNYMQPTVDACDDFFRFSCGNWAKINPVDTGNLRETNFFELLSQAYRQKQLRVLQQESKAVDNTASVKAKKFFKSCLHLHEQSKADYKFQLWQIIEEFGQMPALLPAAAWQADAFDWIETIGKIQNRYGLDIIFQVGIREDFENRNITKLFIGQPQLALQTKSMYTDEASKWHREQYKQNIQKNLQKFLDVDEVIAVKTANEILSFEVHLANGLLDRKLGKTLKSMTKLRTVDEFQQAYAPAIDVKKFIRTTLGYELNTTLYEYYTDYQLNLVNVIRTTPPQQLANYIMYQLLKNFFYEHDEPLTSVRENTCLMKTKLFFANILDNIVYRTYNNKATEDNINLIWHKIKETFRSELTSEKLNWITLMTRKMALEKLEAMRLEISSYEKSNFTKEYEHVTISDKKYVENLKLLFSHKASEVLGELSKPPRPIEAALLFSYTPAYIARENVIKIPVSLLQPNFLWSDHYPNALKFGTLGYLIAHELIHGFDDMGRNFDITGSEHGWWDTESTVAFDERKECFKNQYARYRYGGKYLPESELQSENIADNGAIQIAYAAYMNWLVAVKENFTSLEPKDKISKEKEKWQLLQLESLPNMNYSNTQLFFISFAQYWCNDVDENFKNKISLISVHAPARFRVIGSLANFKEFSKEFRCARGTTMNPEKKCQIY